jgi:hypothetical protein
MDEISLGFLSSFDFENGTTVRGAILVTDDQTKPVEFRVTSPIRPSVNLQKLSDQNFDFIKRYFPLN